MMRSRAKPIAPIVKTATMICARVSLLPFWNMSQTNFPRPGFWASISAAISTIQPTPRERRRPLKIQGSAEGITILRMRTGQERRSTRATFRWSRSTEATPRAVFTSVGQTEQSATVIAELRNDFSNQPLARAAERAHQDHDDRQPGERRDRPEQLDQRIQRGVDRSRWCRTGYPSGTRDQRGDQRSR